MSYVEKIYDIAGATDLTPHQKIALAYGAALEAVQRLEEILKELLETIEWAVGELLR